MKFKFGIYGFSRGELKFVIQMKHFGHKIPPREFDVQDNFIEFHAGGLWVGLNAINIIAETLVHLVPDRFDPHKTKIWVNGDALDLFLLDQLRIAEEGLRAAAQLLKQGRSKKPAISNDKARLARVKIQTVLDALQLS